jgi:hypothetical protein
MRIFQTPLMEGCVGCCQFEPIEEATIVIAALSVVGRKEKQGNPYV